MAKLHRVVAALAALVFVSGVTAAVNIYTELPSGTITPVPHAVATLRAYNTSTLVARPLPTQMPNLAPVAQLYPGALLGRSRLPVATFLTSLLLRHHIQGGMDGLSAPAKGNFLGFSVELSVANQMRQFIC